ncbi:MAG TPA: hypothetical protein VK457_11130 [Chloroflexota bacterium]|nr:hypothetical protein [Chloroflexota bacterium]
MAEPAEADQLYSLPLAEFTPARNALATRLRKQGDRAGSAAVKALAKPSISAWVLNQVARRQAELVERLLNAGQALGKAQQALLGGHGQSEFREATQAEREAVAQLVRAAAAVLAEDGHAVTKATLDRLEATARAAATDPDSGAQLRAGRLTTDLDPTGFGGLTAGPFGAPAAPIPFPTRRAAAPSPAPAPESKALAAAREDVDRLQQHLRALRRAEHDAAEELAGIRAELDRTARELDRTTAKVRQLGGA